MQMPPVVNKNPSTRSAFSCRSRVCRALASGALSAAVLFVLVVTVPLPMERVDLPQAYRYYDRHGELLSVLISRDGYFRMSTQRREIPDLFVEALLTHEDRYFYDHPGVNPLAIVRAAVSNIRAGGVVSGGSTITMQLARMLERRDRTLWTKMIEAFRALQLEWRYDKDEIIEFYLALAPYGGNLEGLSAASYFYFGKAPSMLSVGETALLVGLPQSPNRYRPDQHPVAAREMRDHVLQEMRENGLIDADQLKRAKAEPLPTQRNEAAQLAVHTAWSLRLAHPGRTQIRTTLDRNIQQRTAQVLSGYVETLKAYGISNASSVVIDNQTREVVAIVGSTDYFDRERLGANDGARMVRSPGSTLKPFLYALGFELGLISEKTILYDIPVNYGGYSPENYAKNFRGLVTVREALTDSLNVVAVNLTREVGLERLHALLQAGGLSGLKEDAAYYGLPLILGGVEVSLLDLTNLYATLAQGGVYRPYRLVESDPAGTPKRLLSPEAVWLVTHILTDVERPDFPQSWSFARNRATVAWKTGTSYGHQDAWSVGYTPRFTIGVWVGNFDSRPASHLAGSKVAAPLLFDLFQALEDSGDRRWFAKPEQVRERQVCRSCGRLPTPACRSFTTEYYIAGVKGPANEAYCRVPQLIAVDRRTGAPAGDRTPAAAVERKVFDIWPSRMASFLARHGVPVDRVPPYDPGNMAGEAYYPPEILSPVADAIYYRRLDHLALDDHAIKLSAAVTNRIRTVSWFLDGKLIYQGSPWKDRLINPPPGDHHLRLVDDVGGEAVMTLQVRDYRELAHGQ